MKKLIFLLAGCILISFTGCEKDILKENAAIHSSKNPELLEICHYDAENDTYHTISINSNAWAAHEAHGDMLGNCIGENCNQVWMDKNLDVTTYRNGDVIPQVTDPVTWRNLTTGAWTYYNNDPSTNNTFGKMYNMYALLDPRGLAPEGWHIPSLEEWQVLSDCYGGDQLAGGPLKSTGTVEAGTGVWLDPNTGATNSSGFTGHPGGSRDILGTFATKGRMGLWWSSTINTNDPDYYHIRVLFHDNIQFLEGTAKKPLGLSVRLLRD